MVKNMTSIIVILLIIFALDAENKAGAAAVLAVDTRMALLFSPENIPQFKALKLRSELEKQMKESTTFLDRKLVNWIKTNVSPKTGLPYSFYIPEALKGVAYSQMGDAESVPSIIERVIVEEGLDVYDGAVGQIVFAMIGGPDNLDYAYKPVEVYWKGRVGDLDNIRAGYPINQFVYDPSDPGAVSSDLSQEGKRGFIFRIINAEGKYNTADPLDGKTLSDRFPTWPTIHWEDWKPVAGENAWVVMAAMHLYHKKYYDVKSGEYMHNTDAVELKLSKEIARAALLLQAENGGIRMAPLGTFRNPKDFMSEKTKQGTWWYNQISSENNISWYSAFRMLWEVTGDNTYKEAMSRIESYFKSVWNDKGKYFYQGTNYSDGKWRPNDEHFALDVQTWAIDAFGPELIDEWFGDKTAYQIWENARTLSGYNNHEGNFAGVGYIEEKDRLSVEWTAGAIMAAQILAEYYRDGHPYLASQSLEDAHDMRRGIELLRKDLPEDRAAYAYSSKREWIPFGWYSHSPYVYSLASTGWVIFVDTKFNPFYLPDQNLIKNHVEVSGLKE